MTEQTPPDHDPAHEQAQTGAHESTLTSEASPQSPIGEPEPFTEIENLLQENNALKDKVLRTMAEMENLRRRTEREVADAKLYGVTSFARDMLTFADNLRRAVESVAAEEKEGASPALKSFVEGIELTERDLEILRLLAAGHSLVEISKRLGIAYKTVANTLSRIKEKLGVSQTSELIRIAMGRGLADLV